MAEASFPIRQLRTSVTSPIVTSPSPVMPVPVSPNPLMDSMSGLLTFKPKDKANAHNSRSSINYNPISTTADLRLPAEIFASDDSVSDAGLVNAEDLSAQATTLLAVDPTPSTAIDQMIGGVNIKLEKPETTRKVKSSKKCKDALSNIRIDNIKTELQDDVDWNNMSLAPVNNNTDVTRFQSM